MTDLERLEKHSVPEPNTGCVLWVGTYMNSGYGEIIVMGKHHGAHRLAWLANNGPIPPGLSVLHKCDVKGCVNPRHLFLGTQKENLIDMSRKGRGWWARRTHCPQGHPYAGDNLYAIGNHRMCRACAKARNMARSAARKARASLSPSGAIAQKEN